MIFYLLLSSGKKNNKFLMAVPLKDPLLKLTITAISNPKAMGFK
jgi:hypothetical protein